MFLSLLEQLKLVLKLKGFEITVVITRK